MGFLGVRFEVGGGGGKITPAPSCLKLIRIMLDASHLARKYGGSEVCPISGDWDKLWIPNLAQISLIECY